MRKQQLQTPNGGRFLTSSLALQASNPPGNGIANDRFRHKSGGSGGGGGGSGGSGGGGGGGGGSTVTQGERQTLNMNYEE